MARMILVLACITAHPQKWQFIAAMWMLDESCTA